MAAPEGAINAPAADSEPAPALTLLNALARAPAAAALVVAALGRLEDRKALRLAHTKLRDAVGEATTTLTVAWARAQTRPPTPALAAPRGAGHSVGTPGDPGGARG